MFDNFFVFLKWWWWDIKHPQPQHPHGIRVYCAGAKSGKTVSAVEYLLRTKKDFPDWHFYSNIDLPFQDGKVQTMEELIATPANSIIFLDEVNLLLNSRDWKDAPKELLPVLSQHRHIWKQVIFTAQSFDHIDKQVRDFCTEIVNVSNVANRWFFQKAFRQEDFKLVKIANPDDGVAEYINERVIWKYDFVADNALFETYDTYAIISKTLSGKETVKISTIANMAFPLGQTKELKLKPPFVIKNF